MTDRLLAGPQAASHFAINAAGVIGARVQIFLAAAQLEKIEEFRFELRGSGAVAKWAEVDRRAPADMTRDLVRGNGLDRISLT